MKDGVHTYGEFDTLTHEMEYGVTMPEGFSVYVMRSRENGSYSVEARLDRSWIVFAKDQSALDDYLFLIGAHNIFSGTSFEDGHQSYWIWNTEDEDLAWNIAVFAEDFLKTELLPWD